MAEVEELEYGLKLIIMTDCDNRLMTTHQTPPPSSSFPPSTKTIIFFSPPHLLRCCFGEWFQTSNSLPSR